MTSQLHDAKRHMVTKSTRRHEVMQSNNNGGLLSQRSGGCTRGQSVGGGRNAEMPPEAADEVDARSAPAGSSRVGYGPPGIAQVFNSLFQAQPIQGLVEPGLGVLRKRRDTCPGCKPKTCATTLRSSASPQLVCQKGVRYERTVCQSTKRFCRSSFRNEELGVALADDVVLGRWTHVVGSRAHNVDPS